MKARGGLGLGLSVSRRATRAAAVSAYLASVVALSLQAVDDLRVGGPTTVGPRSAYTKVLGVDTLPAGVTYQDGSSRYPHLTGAEWVNNLNYLTAAAIAVP